MKPLRFFCNFSTQNFLQLGVRDVLRSHVKSKKSKYQECVLPVLVVDSLLLFVSSFFLSFFL